MKNNKRPREDNERAIGDGLHKLSRCRATTIKLKIQKINDQWQSMIIVDPEFEWIETEYVEGLKSAIGPEKTNIIDREGQSLLVRAVEKGNIEIIEHLIIQGANVNWQDDYGNSVLHIAVEEGDPIIINELLRAGADIHHKNIDKQTALEFAVKRADYDSAGLILDKLIELNAIFEIEELLINALRDADYQMIGLLSNLEGIEFKKMLQEIFEEALVNSDEDLLLLFNQEYIDFESVVQASFRDALLNADANILNLLLKLENSGIDINAKFSLEDPNVWPVMLSPLYIIFDNLNTVTPDLEEKRHSYTECLKVLLQNGADVLSIDDELWQKYVIELQNKAIHIATARKGKDLLEEAQELGYYSKEITFSYLFILSNYNYKDLQMYQYTPSARSLYYKILRYKSSLDHEINIDFEDIYINPQYDDIICDLFKNSLSYTYENARVNIIDFLDYFSAISKFKNKYDSIFLKLFEKDINLDYLLMLINHGIDFNEANLLSHICASNYRGVKKISAMKMLIQNGADVNNHKYPQATPLFSAYKDIEALHLLLKCGARVNDLISDDSKTILDMIYDSRKNTWKKHLDAIKLLIHYGAKFNINTPTKTKHHKIIKAEIDKLIQDSANNFNKISSDHPLAKYIENDSDQFIQKLSTVFDGKAKSDSGKNLALPEDIIKYIASYFNPEEMLEFFPVCKGRGTTYNKYKSQITLLEESGKKVIDVESDGNCFFRAIAFDIEGKDDH